MEENLYLVIAAVVRKLFRRRRFRRTLLDIPDVGSRNFPVSVRKNVPAKIRILLALVEADKSSFGARRPGAGCQARDGVLRSDRVRLDPGRGPVRVRMKRWCRGCKERKWRVRSGKGLVVHGPWKMSLPLVLASPGEQIFFRFKGECFKQS